MKKTGIALLAFFLIANVTVVLFMFNSSVLSAENEYYTTEEEISVEVAVDQEEVDAKSGYERIVFFSNVVLTIYDYIDGKDTESGKKMDW